MKKVGKVLRQLTFKKADLMKSSILILLASLTLAASASAQTLLNIDFGVGAASAKTGPAATGMHTNDFWNLYRNYDPKFMSGMPLVPDGRLERLRLADGSETPMSLAVQNAPGVWGNSSGDPMFDTYIFSQNGSNIVVTLTGLPAGRYHFYLYGHADPDVTGEQNSAFTLRTGTNSVGPVTQLGGSGWKAGSPWQERAQFLVFRDVQVNTNPLVIEVAPGPNGVAVLNGLQIMSRGTSPPRLLAAPAPKAAGPTTNLMFREIHYEGAVSETEARFAVSFQVESVTTNEISSPLFEGEVALVSPEVPEGLRIVSQGNQTRLFCTAPGSYAVKLDLVAKITKAEPWNQISFLGPPAAIASVTARASMAGTELQLLSGTPLTEPAPSAGTSPAPLRGFLGADRQLAMRWQSKAAEVTRKSLVTVDTAASAQVTPLVIKYTTVLRYDILQAPVPSLTIALPASHALTRIQGEQIRDWHVKPDGSRQVLSVDFIKPVEKSSVITLFSEQAVEGTPVVATLVPPQPLEVDRESGSFTISADDTTVEIESTPGLRQVNAPGGALAAYRWNGRPVSVSARLKRIEPVLKLADRATVRVEETRLLVAHSLELSVEKAGIYALDLGPQPGFTVSDVKGEGIDTWKAQDNRLKVAFTSRVLGARHLDVQLERATKEFTNRITVQPLSLTGATNVTTQVGAASAPGIRLKTDELTGLREVPISSLPNRTDELLAFASDQPGWSLTLAAEKLAARVVAEVFDLVTVGDGLVGGSATIRFGIINQGVQQFRIAVPSHWKNLDFTGSNIRRKEQQTNVWTITLQDKAWGGYTLLITYDYQFDPKGATLDLAGAHTLDTERETGSLGVMTAANLKLTPAATAAPLQRVDETDLSESDRALCTRPLLLAYKYTGRDFHHSLQVTRYEEEKVLDAVADRIELTTVLNEEGQLLTQSSFMVKNNDKQFQRFKLPTNSEFWSSYVNGQPAKPEKDGDWLLVPLPRDANRDQAFAVDIVYAQTNSFNLHSALFPRRMELAAPVTDVANTYAEWQLFVPPTERLSTFEGNMTVARGTTYDFQDAWREFVQFYGVLIERNYGALILLFVLAVLVVLIIAAFRRGFQGALAVIAVFAILAILGAMMLPALARAKSRAQRINAANNLKQVGLAWKTFTMDNGYVPSSLEAMTNEIGTDKILIDPATGQRFVYVGAGKSEANPQAVIAYSPSDANGRAVLFADGSVQVLTPEKFQEALQRDAALPRAVFSANAPATITVAPPPAAPGMAQGTRGAGRRGGGGAQGPGGFVAGGAIGGLAMNEGNLDASQPMAQQGAFTAAVTQAEANPTATGIRPIRIEVPRAGDAFSFTKVLNADNKPLTIHVSMMRLKVYRTAQMILQVCAFVVGLAMLGWLAMQPVRRSFWMALALGLVLWSVARLLMMWRVLHFGLIVAVPLLVLVILVWIARGFWQRRRTRLAASQSVAQPQVPPAATGLTPPATAGLILFLALAVSSSFAQETSSVPSSNTVSILSANYTGTVRDKTAQFDAELRISTAADNQQMPLFADDVALESFSVQGDNSAAAKLVRQGRQVSVLIPARTNVTLQFKLLAKLGGDVSRRQLAFGIPPALASRVNVLLDEPDADVEFPSAVSFQRSSTNQQTRVQAVIGAAARVEMNWTPRVKRAAEIAATVFAQNTALVTLGGGVVNTRAVFDYQITQGELKLARLQIPAGQRLLRVEGEAIRTWEVKDNALTLDLLKGVSPAYKLTVETEKVLTQLPATVNVELPHALDVKRETGLVALRSEDELELTVENASELQRVDTAEFLRSYTSSTAETRNPIMSPAGATTMATQEMRTSSLSDTARVSPAPQALGSAFRFLRTDFGLIVRAQTVQPQIEAVTYNNVRVSSESAAIAAQIEYTIKRAGVFSLRLALPAGYRVDSITGTNVSQWIDRTEGGVRLAEVTLKERAIGPSTINAVLSQSFAEVPRSLPIVGVHPLNVEKLTGYITVTTEVGIAAKTESFDGLTEVPFASVGRTGSTVAMSGSSLAYKFIATTATPQPGWRLSVSTEAIDPWVRAEIANTLRVTETLVSGRALVKFDIANAPIKEFRLRIPAAYQNVEVTGAQIRRRDQTNDEWRVELQGKVRGEYTLTVTWELPRNPNTNLVILAGIQALNVEREAGYIAVVARPPLQVADKSPAGALAQIDARELPAWSGQADPATVLAYRYLRPGYRLALEVNRFAEAEVLQALIENARFTTVVADDGQMMTELSLSVRNNGRQYLEIELPDKTTLWSAFVGGEPVRPSKREGKLLLPLARDVASDAPIAIELTYIGTGSFPRHSGTVGLLSPQFDVPLKNARWDLYLPPDYDYSRFQGSMSLSRTAEAIPVAKVYSLSEYNVQQQEQQQKKVADVQNEISKARVNLANSSNLRQSVAGVNRLAMPGNANNWQNSSQDFEVQALQEDVKRAQISNIIQAQERYSLSNSGVFYAPQEVWQASASQNQPLPRQGAQAPAVGLNSDTLVAGQQWDKIAKAQQVPTAKVSPLRVNLPTRGLHYSFSQVLQTEPRKPMSVRLYAENTKVPSWISRVGLALIGFCVLWLIAALLPRRAKGT